MKKLFAALVALAIMGTAFAQTKFPLFINCSEMGADVYVNNNLYTKTAPNLKIQLPPAVYNIKISKLGFLEFNANVTVKATSTGNVLSAVLQPAPIAQAPATIGSPNKIVPSFPLRIASNVQGAQILIDGVMVGTVPNEVQIKLGNHEVRVVAPGFMDFVQNVDVKGLVNLTANLQGQNQQLIVQSNVQGASVFINGNLAGTTPFQAQVPAGSYSVQVKAPGYSDYSQNVVVGSGPAQVNATLAGLSYQVSVDANVRGALVFVNGQQLGQTPLTTALPMGSYVIIVRAPGFLDYQAQFAVNGPQAIKATLMPQSASWQLKVPDSFVYKDTGKDNGNGKDRGNRPLYIVQLWIDGQLQDGTAGVILPGRHVIRLVSGGLMAETQIDVVAGKAYSFEPSIFINVK
jgi:hypothetical protein